MKLVGPEIVQQLKADQKSAFEELYQLFYPKLTYFSNQYLLDSIEAENIVQEVFANLWERRAQLANDTNIQAWLFTVTKNKSLKRIEKMRSAQHYADYLKMRQLDVNYQSLIVFDTSNLIFDELQAKLDQALAKLSPQVRIVFEKSRFEEKKNKEIAEELGISIKTVEAHISKSLKHLRVEMKDYLPLLYFLFFLK